MPYSEEILTWTYKSIVAECRAKGVLPIFVFMPLLEESQYDEEIPTILRIAKESGFVILDLGNVFKGHDVTALRLAEWDSHPNVKAHELLANRLYDLMSENAELIFPTPIAARKGE